MSKEEVVALLCALASQVAKEKYGNEIPADCFCVERPSNGGFFFEFHPEVFAFIANAVHGALRNQQMETPDENHQGRT